MPPPSRVVRDDVKLGADDDSDGNCSDASEALVRVGYMRADRSVEPAEIVMTYPDGLHRVRLLSSGKEKRGVTEARLVRDEMRGGGAAAAPPSPLLRSVGPRGGARGSSVASSARTTSSVAAAESDFPSIYSQFGGDEVSLSSVKQPGRWKNIDSKLQNLDSKLNE